MLDLSEIPTDLSGGFREVKTDKGTVVPSDLVFICIGMSVNKTVYANNLGELSDMLPLGNKLWADLDRGRGRVHLRYHGETKTIF